MIYRLLRYAFFCFICFLGTIELWGQRRRLSFLHCSFHIIPVCATQNHKYCMKPDSFIETICYAPSLSITSQHMGKDWKMPSVVLYFKIFIGPEWNDALIATSLCCLESLLVLHWDDVILVPLTHSVYNFLYSEPAF